MNITLPKSIVIPLSIILILEAAHQIMNWAIFLAQVVAR